MLFDVIYLLKLHFILCMLFKIYIFIVTTTFYYGLLNLFKNPRISFIGVILSLKLYNGEIK